MGESLVTEFSSGAPAARRVAKRSTRTLGTEPHASVEIETHATLLSWSTWLAQHGLQVRAPHDDDKRRRRAGSALVYSVHL